ncbi:hypothetical protein D920_01932 [Enterococcus faecalis 13-SD-W-01]|nr:hypothetical protein D920_01932 [Enterococcus faecalis 13-SD-W-01]
MKHSEKKNFSFFSKDELHRKKLKKFKALKNELEVKSIDEFDMRYIENKETLSRKKFIQKSFIVVWFLSFLSVCFAILKNTAVAFVKYLNGDVTKAASDITMYVVITVICILILLLIFCLIIVIVLFNDIKKIERELFLMDQIREKRMGKK